MAYIDKINKNSTDYDLQDSKAARSVDGTTSSHVELTNQIYTESTQATTASFAYRTTAGDVSIETGDATIQYIDGNTVQTGHTDEVLNTTGIFADSGTTVALTAATWRTYVSTDGTYNFSYDGTNWKLNGATVTLADYGLTVTGTVTEGDSITVEYTQLVIGTLATATPVSFVATGFNQYDATAGYAHVVGGNQYRIAGTYTSLGFTTTVGGATTPVTVTDNRFTPTEDGYIYVTGGSGNILIALVWSGTMDSEPYTAYATSTITIPTKDASNNDLPTATYGMPSVHGVADRLSFADKTYIQRIGHYTYSAENLATVEAMGVDYWYDTNDIFYVLASPVTYTLAASVSGEYTANDYGTEEITGTSVPMSVNIVYGNSLVDKLRNMLPIQSIGTGLTLTGTELSASGGGQSTLYDTTGQNTDGAMTQKATTNMVLNPTYGSVCIGIKGTYQMVEGYQQVAIGRAVRAGTGTNNIVIGNVATGTGNGYSGSISIGSNTDSSSAATISIGENAKASGLHSVAFGSYSNATEKGQMDISTLGSTNTNGYNNSQYRLLTGLYAPQSSHDAANKEYVDPTTDSSAPTTATVGRLGQIYIDTSTATAYMCVDATNPYVWKQITV